MSHVTFTELRANMAQHFDRIEADRTELVVTRQNHEPVVVMPLSELEGTARDHSSAQQSSQCRAAARSDRRT